MTHPTHGFQTPAAREGWAIGLEYLLEVQACSSRPTTLPSASPQAIAEELARLTKIHRHEYRGRPAEL